MALVEIRLLGGFSASVTGTPVDLPGQKERALLAFLAAEPGRLHRRERLAGLLWGESSEARARDSLKHALGHLRQALGAGAAMLEAGRQAVRADPSACWLDIAEFETLARSDREEALDQALALWGGDLLDGLTVDEPGFEEWRVQRAARLRQTADQASMRYLALMAENRDPEKMIAAARRSLRLDPQSERACRLLMRGLAAAGDRVQAMSAYRDFSALLRAALDVAPEVETVRLFQEIRAGAADSASARNPIAEPPRPSVAVLPFQTLAGAEKWFAEGIAEEIITALSRVRGIDLIARNSSFTLGAEGPPSEVRRALGARYLVQGCAQRSDSTVRINVRLADAGTGSILWSETYDEALSDIFALQDRIAARVAGTLLPRLEAAEIARSSRKPTANLDAYDYYLRGLPEMHRWSKVSCERAMAHFRRAAELDPGFAAAHVMLVRCYSQRKASGWMTDMDAETADALRLARLAAELAPDDALVLAVAGLGLGYIAGQPEQGVRLTERSLALNPNLAWGWLFSGWMHVWLGLGRTAREHVARAMRLSPQDPQFMMMQAATAWALFTEGRASEAADWAEAAVTGNPNVMIAWCALAAAREGSGDADGARAAMAELLRLEPSLRASNLLLFFPIRGEANIRTWMAALARAGLPE
ncbi:BTAD domain-containing putative transcriptional regulator [Poseidonocella sp. HB161398]|uniref:BTAD domain-containing putative transcriptional regulator n=1 Tax=Poseidonocella sp. HB161398 TaxID=2320855 RepID=UPI001109066C|nr:BTAD domain-containing putative transcriptional regulator [Poseidonocella sp. HB161398]